MVEYRIGIKGIDWTKLTELYGEVGLVGGFGRKKDQNKIREAFQVSDKVVTAWDKEKLVAAGRMRDNVHFAAGLAICEAAGCIATDLRGRLWGSGATGAVVAADSETHTAILSLVRKYLV
jgi:hypothetical protein